MLAAAWTRSVEVSELRELRGRYETRAREWIAADELADLRRADGCLYTVDLAQLMLYFARVGDRGTYETLRRYAIEHVYVDRDDDPYTRGFVAWRHEPGQPLDASGTTEALRLAEALWAGADAFGLDDRDRVHLIIDGYARHAYVEHGVWLVRNYFNFGTRAFSNDSFLVDYHGDLIAKLATALGNEKLGAIAERTYALVERAVAPSGLIYSLVQPDIRTLIPEMDVTIFSPNDVVQISNSCSVAETVVVGAPRIARGVLDFALRRFGRLRRYFLGRTGRPVGPAYAEIGAMTCLARLAARFDDGDAVERITARAIWRWREFLESEHPPRAYTASEVLLALDAVLGSGFALEDEVER